MPAALGHSAASEKDGRGQTQSFVLRILHPRTEKRKIKFDPISFLKLLSDWFFVRQLLAGFARPLTAIKRKSHLSCSVSAKVAHRPS
jgi:hypothetical protein